MMNKSVKHRLFLSTLLELLLAVSFFVYLVIAETIRSYDDMSIRIYQLEEQMLTHLSSYIHTAENVTLAPIQLYENSNNDTILSVLRKNQLNNNYSFYMEFNRIIRPYFLDGFTDFIAIYDLEGNCVYANKGSVYQTGHIRQSADWYHNCLATSNGSSTIISPDQFTGSGIPDRDGRSLVVCRNIVDINTFKVTGVCLVGTDIDTIQDYFNKNKLFDTQDYYFYLNQQQLIGDQQFSKNSVLNLPDKTDTRNQHLKLENFSAIMYHSISKENGYALTIRTPLFSAKSYFKAYRSVYIIFVALLLCCITILNRKIVQGILNPLNSLVKVCNRFATDTTLSVSLENLPVELAELFTAFNQMACKINSLIHEVLMKGLEQKNTELQFLRSQINPHYLYNTLEVMHILAYKNKDYDVATISELLGKNLQYGLRNPSQKVTLQTEISHLKKHLEILSYQYKNKLLFNIFVPEEILNCSVIKLLFQPIVENAVCHGFCDSAQVLTIDIYCYRNKDQLVLTISDNGIGMEVETLRTIQAEITSESSEHIGIKNVARRLELNYGSESSFTINSKLGEGTTVTIVLPYREMTEIAET